MVLGGRGLRRSRAQVNPVGRGPNPPYRTPSGIPVSGEKASPGSRGGLRPGAAGCTEGSLNTGGVTMSVTCTYTNKDGRWIRARDGWIVAAELRRWRSRPLAEALTVGFRKIVGRATPRNTAHNLLEPNDISDSLRSYLGPG